jgi:polysaccharide pyruvyl transferase WcaK-like protein
MRIFVIPGTADCANLGDVAMLQAALQRLETLWPEATFQVLTQSAEALKAYCPEAIPVPQRGCNHWLRAGGLKAMPAHDSGTAGKWSWSSVLSPPRHQQTVEFTEALFHADLVVLAGCGLINDAFEGSALRVLDTLDAAMQKGIPVVMLGQGLGPARSQALRERLAEVLPRAQAIFVRDGGASEGLLENAGVPRDKFFVTGDDAIELAWWERPAAVGNSLGINLRLADYSGLDEPIAEGVKEVLRQRAKHWGVELVGIPILCGGPDSDLETLGGFARGKQAYKQTSTGARGRITPAEVARRVSGCRVVVTASYHAGVFALAQGVPVVAIIRSAYYRDKFQGLAGQFDAGCILLYADDPGFYGKLGLAVEQSWQEVRAVRPKLLAAAERQVNEARQAYARLPALVAGQRHSGQAREYLT